MKHYYALIVAALLAGCGPEKVSFETVDQSQGIAKKNGTFNAKTFRSSYYPDAEIIPRGDSTISATCPQGDGWASIDIVKDGRVMAELKCSTVSANLGCMTKKDFSGRAQYSNQENNCNKEIPFPLPRLAE